MQNKTHASQHEHHNKEKWKQIRKTDWCMQISNDWECWERKDIIQGWVEICLTKFATGRKTQCPH